MHLFGPKGRLPGFMGFVLVFIFIFVGLVDELDICLLLVHHLRKQGDSDPFNKLTGTTGIVGAVDTAVVLDPKRQRPPIRLFTQAIFLCTISFLSW